MIYLDYAANYPTKKEVLDYLSFLELNYYGNYNSIHKEGIKTKEKFNEIDNHIKIILGLDESFELIYTSSATESNNLAIKGIVGSYSGFGKTILVSEHEHSSVNGTLGYLKELGYNIEFIETLDDGEIDFYDLESKLNKDVILVCLVLVDGETGFIHDYKKAYEIISKFKNVHYLVDATQAIGKMKVDFSYCELVSFTPHKFGGLIGTGVLIKKKKTILKPLITGGESSSIYRSGSVPLGLIGSIEKSLEIGYLNLDKNYEYVKSLNEYLLSKIKDNKNIQINSFNNPYIVNISIKNRLAKDSVSYFSDHDICISQKSACSIKNTPSKIIMSIYKDKKRALSSFRISLSELVKKEELDEFIKVLEDYINGK